MIQTNNRNATIQKSLGLTPIEADIYFFLLKVGLSSVSTIKKNMNTSRTNLYRALRNLISKQLVREVIGENSTLFETCSYDDLKMKIWGDEVEMKSLEDDLPRVMEFLSDKIQYDIKDTEVKYYEGYDGFMQALWNQTKSKDEFRIYEISMLNDFTSDNFCREVIIEFVRNKIMDYQLTNLSNFEEFTDVDEFVKNFWQVRYVEKKQLPIIFECAIYNNVYSMYDYSEGQLFCVEIYNQSLADMQKDIFDLVWKFSKPMKLVNYFGKTKISL
ncbi:hypothetical protein JW887_01725 [Candidatus Dojkabacteria bacterium]|nr:hypothetical protein [Candidatus Dojkabacteria bacterium]